MAFKLFPLMLLATAADATPGTDCKNGYHEGAGAFIVNWFADAAAALEMPDTDEAGLKALCHELVCEMKLYPGRAPEGWRTTILQNAEADGGSMGTAMEVFNPSKHGIFAFGAAWKYGVCEAQVVNFEVEKWADGALAGEESNDDANYESCYLDCSGYNFGASTDPSSPQSGFFAGSSSEEEGPENKQQQEEESSSKTSKSKSKKGKSSSSSSKTRKGKKMNSKKSSKKGKSSSSDSAEAKVGGYESQSSKSKSGKKSKKSKKSKSSSPSSSSAESEAAMAATMAGTQTPSLAPSALTGMAVALAIVGAVVVNARRSKANQKKAPRLHISTYQAIPREANPSLA